MEGWELRFKFFHGKNFMRSVDTSHQKQGGGDKQVWISTLDLKPTMLNELKYMGEEQRVRLLRNIDRLNLPVTLDPATSTFDDVALHGFLRQRLGWSTIERNLRYARFMETHPCPVDFRHPTYENFIRHMDYREQVEGCGWGALKHEYQAMTMFLRAWGINPKSWPYRPPKQPLYQVRFIPNPDQVHKMIHLKYSDEPYRNALCRYLITHNFLIGWRFPSEPSVMKVTDVDIDSGIMIVKQPKLHNATKMLDISEIADRHNIFSFKNWIDKWRCKVQNQYSGDALYLKPDGRPFDNPEHLRVFLQRYAVPKMKQVFPKQYNYLSRHWCAVARLIRSKIETGKFDEFAVSQWLGHTKIETTMNYIQDADFYYRKYNYDWIKRILRQPG
ncbi:MAG: hypothetical protein DRN12_06500, partial [Thermoplasmata archaeon]